MQLNDILAFSADQDRGVWCDLPDPVDGKPTGIRLQIVGPDSATQARARLRLVDELAEAADDNGRVSAEARERARLNNLAACVVGWELQEAGKPVPFSTANVLRFLRAALWTQATVDALASDRRLHLRKGG